MQVKGQSAKISYQLTIWFSGWSYRFHSRDLGAIDCLTSIRIQPIVVIRIQAYRMAPTVLLWSARWRMPMVIHWGITFIISASHLSLRRMMVIILDALIFLQLPDSTDHSEGQQEQENFPATQAHFYRCFVSVLNLNALVCLFVFCADYNVECILCTLIAGCGQRKWACHKSKVSLGSSTYTHGQLASVR